jgi:hypothetical protein
LRTIEKKVFKNLVGEVGLDALRVELQFRQHADLAETGGWLLSVYRGWCQYYAVPGN